MSIPDEIMRRYFELCTDVDMEEVGHTKRDVWRSAWPSLRAVSLDWRWLPEARL